MLAKRVKIKILMTGVRQTPILPILVVFVFVVCGLFSQDIAPHDPNKINLTQKHTPPFWQDGGTTNFLLGTDSLGRDLLSRVIFGAGMSLQITLITILISGIVGSTVALLSGYFKGWIDAILMRLVDTMMSMPFIVVAIALAVVLGPSKRNIIIILASFMWAGTARILRSEVLRIRESEFVLLAKVGGASTARIMMRHILPNIINTLVVLATLQVGVVIIAEASLSYLGLGVPPPDPAWGSMIADGTLFLISYWWPSTVPGIAILMVVLSFNLLGDWLRVRLDPKFRQI